MGTSTDTVSREHMVANFEELVTENQIQTAIDLLVYAEPEEQILVIDEAQPGLLVRFVQALDLEDSIEITDQLTPEARQRLLQALEEAALHGRAAAPDQVTEEIESAADLAADLIEDAIEETIKRYPEAAVTVEEAAAPQGRMDFSIVDGRLRRSAPGAGVVTVYCNPSSAAQRDLLESLGIDDHMLESALDPDELSRLEYDHDEKQAFIVVKRPHREAEQSPEQLVIDSIGILLHANSLTIVTPDDTPVVDDGDRAESLHMLLLRILASIVDEFLMELKMVKRTSREIQAKLSKSIENRELLRMFSLSEGLVYHINAIEGNSRVLRRLRHLALRLAFSEQELEYLDDIIIDNDQCSRQGQIFSTILAGMLDARGNLINNNMNILLKNLTIINVVFLPLGVIAGMGGMSEFSLILEHYGVDWKAGYLAFSVAMFAMGLGLFWIVQMFAERWGRTNGSAQRRIGERFKR